MLAARSFAALLTVLECSPSRFRPFVALRFAAVALAGARSFRRQSGASDGTRTHNLRFTKPELYQLSYASARHFAQKVLPVRERVLILQMPISAVNNRRRGVSAAFARSGAAESGGHGTPLSGQ